MSLINYSTLWKCPGSSITRACPPCTEVVSSTQWPRVLIHPELFTPFQTQTLSFSPLSVTISCPITIKPWKATSLTNHDVYSALYTHTDIHIAVLHSGQYMSIKLMYTGLQGQWFKSWLFLQGNFCILSKGHLSIYDVFWTGKTLTVEKNYTGMFSFQTTLFIFFFLYSLQLNSRVF